MKVKLIDICKRPFVRNVAILATGTASAQIIAMIFSPIITRLYGPEAYGVLGVFTGIVGIIAPIAALAYPIAIVLPKHDVEAKNLVRLSLYIAGIVSILIALIIVVFNKPLVELLKLEAIASFLYLIPFVVFFSALLEIISQWLIRTKQFVITAKVSFLQALILNSAKAGIGYFNPTAIVLVIFSSLASVIQALMLFVGMSNSQRKSDIGLYQPVSIIKLAKKYIDFPIFRAPEIFINAISQSLPVFLLASFFGSASVGFYSIGRTVLSMPAQLIGKSVGDVFYPRIAEAANKNENITPLIVKATLALAFTGIIPFGLVIFFGPWLFGFVFGGEWVIAGQYARWLALWAFFGFINRPSISALPVMYAQLFHLKFTIFSLIGRTAVLAIGYYVFSNDLVSIALFGVIGAILNIALIIITIQKSKGFKTRELV